MNAINTHELMQTLGSQAKAASAHMDRAGAAVKNLSLIHI